MFKICGNKGFHITLANGVTISTQFGGGNYCANYEHPIEHYHNGLECKDAEVAIWDKNGDWITAQVANQAGVDEDLGDDVIGRIAIEDWLKLLDTARSIVTEAE